MTFSFAGFEILTAVVIAFCLLQAGFLLRLLVNPDDGSVSLFSTDYTALYPGR
jgi:hypothetical protein